MNERPIEIPYNDLEVFPKTYHRNLLIYALYNLGWNRVQIGASVGISGYQVGQILLGHTTKKVNKERYTKYAEDTKRRVKNYRNLNRALVRTKAQEYYILHKDRIKERVSEWAKNNKQKRTKYTTTHRLKHSERFKERRRNVERIRRSLKKNSFRGYVPDSIEEYLNGKQNGICPLCSTELSGDLEIDHKIPISTERSIECICNLQLTHASCNNKKRDSILSEYEQLNQLSLSLDNIRRDTYE